MLYTLMHQDDPVVVVNIEAGNGISYVSKEIIHPELMPLRHQAQPGGLVLWWRERAVPLSRKGIRQFLQEQGYMGPDQYLVKNLGLSLSDSYWIKPLDSDLSWRQVNLYENDFRTDYFSFPEAEPVSSNKPLYTANSSLQGDLEKTWTIVQGEKTLIKGNSNHLSSESLNEVLATEIYKRQGYHNYVPYRLFSIPDRSYSFGCACENFTSHQAELVTAYDLITSCGKNNQTSYVRHLFDTAAAHGADRDQLQQDFDVMVLGDYVLSGNDRHLNNIGFLRDTRSLKLMRMAPIYDSGCALFVRGELPRNAKDLLRITLNSFSRSERKMLSYVRDKSLLDISKLPPPEWVRDLYARDSAQTEYRLNAVLYAYEKKIDYLRDIQLGRDPYKIMFGGAGHHST